MEIQHLELKECSCLLQLLGTRIMFGNMYGRKGIYYTGICVTIKMYHMLNAGPQTNNNPVLFMTYEESTRMLFTGICYLLAVETFKFQKPPKAN